MPKRLILILYVIMNSTSLSLIILGGLVRQFSLVALAMVLAVVAFAVVSKELHTIEKKK